MITKNEDIRIVKTKKALKTAFIMLLEESTYEKISIIDVCNKAKVHRATFYNYYRSKEDLFTCIIEDIKDSFLQKFNEQSVEFTNSQQLIDYLIDGYIEVSHASMPHLKKIIEVQNPIIIKAIFNRSIYQVFYQILSMYSYGENIFPKDFTASFFSGALTNIAFWYVNQSVVSKEQFRDYLHFFINGDMYAKQYKEYHKNNF